MLHACEPMSFSSYDNGEAIIFDWFSIAAKSYFGLDKILLIIIHIVITNYVYPKQNFLSADLGPSQIF